MRANPIITDENGEVATNPPEGTNFGKMVAFLRKNYTYEGIALSERDAEYIILNQGDFFTYACKRRWSTQSTGEHIAKTQMLTRRRATWVI